MKRDSHILKAALVCTAIGAAAILLLFLAGCATTPVATEAQRSVIVYTTYGMSMWPTIQPSDKIMNERTPYNRLKIGDIVSYVSRFCDTPVNHRIVGGVPGKWIVKGDNNERCDRGYLTPENYLSRVGIIIPQYGQPKILR